MIRVKKRVFGVSSQISAAVSLTLEEAIEEENKRVRAIDKSKELR